MRVTDLMILLIIFGVGFSAVGTYMLNLDTQYESSGYSDTYNPNQYTYLISEQGVAAESASGLAASNTELGSEGTTTDPYRNIFIGGWNAIKDLVGVGSNIEALQSDLQDTTESTGLKVPEFAWFALAAVAAIIFVASLINASQRVEV